MEKKTELWVTVAVIAFNTLVSICATAAFIARPEAFSANMFLGALAIASGASSAAGSVYTHARNKKKALVEIAEMQVRPAAYQAPAVGSTSVPPARLSGPT